MLNFLKKLQNFQKNLFFQKNHWEILDEQVELDNIHKNIKISTGLQKKFGFLTAHQALICPIVKFSRNCILFSSFATFLRESWIVHRKKNLKL